MSLIDTEPLIEREPISFDHNQVLLELREWEDLDRQEAAKVMSVYKVYLSGRAAGFAHAIRIVEEAVRRCKE